MKPKIEFRNKTDFTNELILEKLGKEWMAISEVRRACEGRTALSCDQSFRYRLRKLEKHGLVESRYFGQAEFRKV